MTSSRYSIMGRHERIPACATIERTTSSLASDLREDCPRATDRERGAARACCAHGQDLSFVARVSGPVARMAPAHPHAAADAGARPQHDPRPWPLSQPNALRGGKALLAQLMAVRH